MQKFEKQNLKNLYTPPSDSSGEDNGQITIIGNSDLFHGPTVLALRTASRIVDMVFFTSPYKPTKDITAYLKSELSSFIWVPFEEVDKYIEKSDACLIGPGFKRYSSEGNITEDEDYLKTRNITKKILTNHKNKKWVVDAGSLQTMDAEWLPENCIITPNKKEFEMLFELDPNNENVKKMAKKNSANIVLKGPKTIVQGPEFGYEVEGGNAGLTKGGVGDVLAGLTTALLAKNEPMLAASAASFIQKKAAEELELDIGTYFNADDLANQIPYTFKRLTG